MSFSSPSEAGGRGRAAGDTFWLLLLAGALLLSGLGAYALWDPEEGRHADIARRLGSDGQWLVPHLYGTPYYDKPTAFYWLVRASFAALGPSELAARLPSALATLVTLLLLHRFALRHFGRRAAATAATVYTTLPLVVILGRYCNLDATLNLFLTWATLRWIDWIHGPRTRPPWSAYLAMSLGTLIKGPVGVLLPCLSAMLIAWRRGEGLRTLGAAAPLAGLSLVSGLTLPWLAGTALVEPAYLRTFLLEHNIERFLSSEFEHARDPGYFLRILPALLLPWTLLVPAIAGCPKARLAEPDALGDALVWAVVVIGFFSISQAKLASYVLPAMPPLALWLGVRLAELPTERSERAKIALQIWAAALLLLPIGLGVWIWYVYPHLFLLSAWSLLALPLAATALRAARVAPTRAATPVFATSSTVLFGTFYLATAPAVSEVASDHALARLAAARPEFASTGFRVQPASFSFYSTSEVPRVDAIQGLRARLRHGPLFIVSRRRHEATLTSAGIPLHEWLDNGRHVLYGTVPRSEPLCCLPAEQPSPARERAAS